MDRPARPEGPGARLRAAWAGLGREQRLVLLAALALLATLFLPWYVRTTTTATAAGSPVIVRDPKAAITVFSWVEAALFLVAVAVVALVLARGEKRAFHLPGGDGLVVAVAGGWATFLVFFRFVDKPSVSSGGRVLVDYGLSWGIFFGLLATLALLVSGLMLRAAHVREPVIPGDPPPRADPPADRRPAPRPARPPRPARDAAATVVDARRPAAEAPTTLDAPELPFDQPAQPPEPS